MWMIERKEGIIYDEKKQALTTLNGEYLASVQENEKGVLVVHLGMNTNFKSESGKIRGTGWDGCEEHMGDILLLIEEGGTLDFQEKRCSFSEKAGKNIYIKIKKLEGIIVPTGQHVQPQTENLPKRIANLTRTMFALRQCKLLA